MRKNLYKIICIILVFSLFSLHAYLLRKVSALQEKNITLTEKIEELNKNRNEKIYEYDKLADLKKIEEEMNEKGLVISEKIIFFTVQE